MHAIVIIAIAVLVLPLVTRVIHYRSINVVWDTITEILRDQGAMTDDGLWHELIERGVMVSDDRLDVIMDQMVKQQIVRRWSGERFGKREIWYQLIEKRHPPPGPTRREPTKWWQQWQPKPAFSRALLTLSNQHGERSLFVLK